MDVVSFDGINYYGNIPHVHMETISYFLKIAEYKDINTELVQKLKEENFSYKDYCIPVNTAWGKCLKVISDLNSSFSFVKYRYAEEVEKAVRIEAIDQGKEIYYRLANFVWIRVNIHDRSTEYRKKVKRELANVVFLDNEKNRFKRLGQAINKI